MKKSRFLDTGRTLAARIHSWSRMKSLKKIRKVPRCFLKNMDGDVQKSRRKDGHHWTNWKIGARNAAQRKLEHELGIPPTDVPLESLKYLTRIHYLAPSDGLWGEHESRYPTDSQECCLNPLVSFALLTPDNKLVDYIFITRTKNVKLSPNPNEVKDTRYVTQEDLKNMFKDAGAFLVSH